MDDRKLLLLGLLRQRDMHGYELNEFINRDLASCTDLKKSTAYFLLNKMAEEGWISQQIEQEGNRPPRQVYSLTDSGEEAFFALLRNNLAAYQTISFPGDTGIAFLDVLAPDEALALLQQRRAAMLAALELVNLAPAHRGPQHWLIEHQSLHLSAELAWLDEILLRLQPNPQAAVKPIEE